MRERKLLRPSVFAEGIKRPVAAFGIRRGIKRLEAIYVLMCIGVSLFFFLCPCYYIAAAFMLLCFYAHASTSGTELAPAKVLQVANVQPFSKLGRGGSLDVN